MTRAASEGDAERTVRNGAMNASPVKSAARVLQIFEMFAVIKRPAPLKEIVERLEYPQSSTTVLLKSLVQLGYLHYDREARRYFPTTKISQLSHWLDSRLDDRILALMEEISRATGETVLLASRNDQFIQYQKVIDSSHEIRFHIVEGSQLPLTRTSLGWMFLSQMPLATAERLCKQINARLADKGQKTNINDIAERLKDISDKGYCYLPNLPLRAGGCISMMLPAINGSETFAVGVGGLVDRLNDQLGQILTVMRNAVSRLQSGYQTPTADGPD
ncbi:DNA-binding IclR family transcriptional regulator [Rhodoligotrophos appendicifer]|uniref:IclR family transcriptional regulator n=1 Tax=Rhodoligotrophos appendicifer TaxID=987056 RepID=UPI001184E3F2|nr:IclR family transcriptional regulator [Rhodoligotrophos appendicifer]